MLRAPERKRRIIAARTAFLLAVGWQLIVLVIVGIWFGFSPGMYVISSFGVVAFALLFIPWVTLGPQSGAFVYVPVPIQKHIVTAALAGVPVVLAAIMVLNVVVTLSFWLGCATAGFVLAAEYALVTQLVRRNVAA